MQHAERINPFFQRRVSTDTDTVFASARPEGADKTITRGTDKSVPYESISYRYSIIIYYIIIFINIAKGGGF